MGAKAPLHYSQKNLPWELRPRFIISKKICHWGYGPASLFPKKFALKSMAPLHYSQKYLPLGLRLSFIIRKEIYHVGSGPTSLFQKNLP